MHRATVTFSAARPATTTLSELDLETLKNDVDTLNGTHDTLFDAAIGLIEQA